jgi:hypothetical protein
MDAGSFVGLLRRLSDFLEGVRRSSTFSTLDILFAKAALSEILDFADMLSDTLLFDDLGGAADPTLLGFRAGEFTEGTGPAGGELVAGSAPSSNILGSDVSKTIKFRLTVAAGSPKIVTVTTTPANDTGGKLTLDGLVADTNAALSAAGIPVTASKGGTNNDRVRQKANNAGDSLRLETGFQ